MHDPPPIIQSVRDQLVDLVHPEQIILFGSYAKSSQTSHSDIDVLAVTRAPVAPAQQALARQLFDDFPVKVDVLFCTRDRFSAEAKRPYSFLYTITKRCIILYEEEQTRSVSNWQG